MIRNSVDIYFKSNKENYIKEESGIKPNTFRKVDCKDKRFDELKRFGTTIGEDFYIIIKCDELNCEFKRQIKDVTYWDGYCIISWMS